jgi:hypothetical protein
MSIRDVTAWLAGLWSEIWESSHLLVRWALDQPLWVYGLFLVALLLLRAGGDLWSRVPARAQRLLFWLLTIAVFAAVPLVWLYAS